MSSAESNPHHPTPTKSNSSSPPRSQCAQAPAQDEKKRRRRKKKAAPPDPSKVDIDDKIVVNAEEALNITMPVQEGITNKIEADAMADVMQPPKQSNSTVAFKEEELAGNQSTNNGVCNDNVCRDDNDQLSQVLLDLSSQNAYLKAQFDGLKDQMYDSMETCKQEKEVPNENVDFQQANQLEEDLQKLNKEIEEQKETQKAAEDALKHLRIALSEADSRAEDLSVQLAEAQKKMEEEIKERDDKYVELDSKFGRLHKRAKQRIQELQKEKDDLEVRVRDVNDMAEKASGQQSSMQQELERTRQQASEALRSMDTERQQLRTANNKLRDNIDELHRSLEAKENVLEGLRQSFFEKEQALEETQHMLQVAEEKKQMSLTEVSSKHQKVVESLEAQIAEALHERSKLAETISSLQALVLEKDSKIAELDAASTGEAVRLGAAVEAARAEIASIRDEYEKEKEKWDSACHSLRAKLEASESACLRSEIEAAKLRSQLELELSLQNQLLSTKDSELLAAKEEVVRLESEFSSYKVRAHALLQKKEADLQAAMDTDVIKAQEEAIREAEREVSLALTERDKALQDLQNVIVNHDKEIASRDAALVDAEKQAGILAIKLDHVNGQYLSDKEAWQKSLEEIEESWRLKYNTLEAQKNVVSKNDLERRLEDLQMQHKKLKEEHDTFRDIADRILEEKEKEISKLIEENKSLHLSLESQPPVNYNDNLNSAFVKQDIQSSNVASAEQQILLLAKQQAQREEELAQSQRQILALQDEIEELERENRLHSQQESMLKEELRNMERNQKREGVDMTYLKNVVLKLLETGEVEALLPVVGMLLQFSPEEIRKCQQTYRSTSNIPLSPVASPSDAASSTPRSLFSRFPFT